MRAVFETSWQLLDAAEQAVLSALAIFPAGFSAEAALAVAGAQLHELDSLCEKSLLQQQVEGERYLMHSLVRQFAGDKRAERALDLAHAFVDYYYHFASERRDEYDALRPEWRNFAAAISQAHTLAAWRTVLDFVHVLDEPWFRQVRFGEMRAGLALAVEAAAALADERARAWTLLRLGEIEMELNAYGAAEEHLRDALGCLLVLEDGLGIARAKYLFGRIKSEQGQDDQALKLFEESRIVYEDEKNVLGIAQNLTLIAVHHFKTDWDYQTALAYLEQASALQQQLPPSSSQIETLRYQAHAQLMLEAYTEAEQSLIAAAESCRRQQNIGEYAAVLYEHVLLCKKRGQVEEGLKLGYECLESLRQLGSLRVEALIKTQLGLLHQARNDLDQSLSLLQDGLQIFAELGDSYEQAYSHYYLAQLYAKMGNVEASRNAKEEARKLNLGLNNPQLAAVLNSVVPNRE